MTKERKKGQRKERKDKGKKERTKERKKGQRKNRPPYPSSADAMKEGVGKKCSRSSASPPASSAPSSLLPSLLAPELAAARLSTSVAEGKSRTARLVCQLRPLVRLSFLGTHHRSSVVTVALSLAVVGRAGRWGLNYANDIS